MKRENKDRQEQYHNVKNYGKCIVMFVYLYKYSV